MKVQSRLVNTKRHTVGYKIGGKFRSRREAVLLARHGRVDGVIVRSGGRDEMHLSSAPSSNVKLYDLPVKVVTN